MFIDIVKKGIFNKKYIGTMEFKNGRPINGDVIIFKSIPYKIIGMVHEENVEPCLLVTEMLRL